MAKPGILDSLQAHLAPLMEARTITCTRIKLNIVACFDCFGKSIQVSASKSYCMQYIFDHENTQELAAGQRGKNIQHCCPRSGDAHAREASTSASFPNRENHFS